MQSSARIASHPIHPMLIPFPLALWTTSFAFNLIGSVSDIYLMHQVAYYMAIAGCVGAVLAAIPGVIDVVKAIPPNTEAKRVGYMHGALNVAALVLWIVSLYSRDGGGGMTYIAYITAGIAMVILGVSGWLGGTLVYEHHVGIEPRARGAPRAD